MQRYSLWRLGRSIFHPDTCFLSHVRRPRGRVAFGIFLQGLQFGFVALLGDNSHDPAFEMVNLPDGGVYQMNAFR